MAIKNTNCMGINFMTYACVPDKKSNRTVKNELKKCDISFDGS